MPSPRDPQSTSLLESPPTLTKIWRVVHDGAKVVFPALLIYVTYFPPDWIHWESVPPIVHILFILYWPFRLVMWLVKAVIKAVARTAEKEAIRVRAESLGRRMSRVIPASGLCGSCGAPYSSQDVFCSKCAAPIDQSSAPIDRVS